MVKKGIEGQFAIRRLRTYGNLGVWSRLELINDLGWGELISLLFDFFPSVLNFKTMTERFFRVLISRLNLKLWGSNERKRGKVGETFGRFQFGLMKDGVLSFSLISTVDKFLFSYCGISDIDEAELRISFKRPINAGEIVWYFDTVSSHSKFDHEYFPTTKSDW